MIFLDRCSLAVALALMVSIWQPLVADEAALYGEAPPENAAFVRLLSEYAGPESNVFFGGATLSFEDIERDTYVAISAVELPSVSAGEYYSLASGAGGALMIAEPARETAAKVHLILVNAGEEPVRLIVPGPNAEVIASLESGEASSRAVNPVSTPLAVERIRDGHRLGMFEVTLSRGQNLTFVATSNDARLVRNAFGPVLSVN